MSYNGDVGIVRSVRESNQTKGREKSSEDLHLEPTLCETSVDEVGNLSRLQ